MINSHFVSEEEVAALTKFAIKHDRMLLFGFDSSEEDCNKRKQRKLLNKDNRKWAWITVCNTRKMCWVDNKTMKAYKPDGYSPTWIEIKKFVFERWCTLHDL